MSDANKDEGEDGDVTQEEIDDARNLSRKAVLCGIMHQVDKEPRYDFTPEFMEYLAITGEVLNENPEPVKKLTAESLENDFHFFQTIISRFLAYNRVFERKTAGLNNWQKFTVVISNQEVEDEQDLMLKAHEQDQSVRPNFFNDLYDLTYLTHGMLTSIFKQDRLIPFIMKMAKN
jgi:hypothetical protein